MTKNRVQSAALAALRTLLILSVFVGTILIVIQRPQKRIFVNKYADFYIDYADGTTKFSDGQNFGMVNRGDVVTVRLRLPQEPILDDAVLTFFIYHSVTQVRCGDVLLDAYGADIAARGDMVSSHYFLVPIPDEAWGGEITITLNVTENGAFNRVKNLGIYPKQHAYEYFIDMDIVGFLVGSSLLLVGLMALAVFLMIGRFSTASRKGIYISAFAILASAWILTKTGVQHLFGFDGYALTQMEFVAAFTMVLPILLWAYETQEKGTRMRGVLCGAVLVNGAFFVVATVLHLTNVLHYCATLLLSNCLTFVSGVLLMVFAVRRRTRGSDSDRVFFSGMVILFSTGLFDLLRMNIYKYLPSLFKKSLPSVLAMGMLFFIIYMLCSYLMETKEKQKRLITAQVEAENRSRMLDSTPAGICRLETDERLTISAANDMFYDIIGYTPQELSDAGYTSVLAALGEEGRQKLLETYETLMRSGDTAGELELSVPSADGGSRTVFARYFYDRTGSGKITVNVIDITDRKRMEEELRVSEKRYKLALTQSGKVFFFDVPTRTMRLSDELAQAFGLPTEVDNMPENFISLGLVEPRSVENYRNFYAVNTFEWCAADTQPEQENLLKLPAEALTPYYETLFDHDGLLYCYDVRTLSAPLYAVLEPQGIQSMLQCVLECGGTPFGMVGFDECRARRYWNGRQIKALSGFAKSLSEVLYTYRQQHGKSLAQLQQSAIGLWDGGTEAE